MTAVSRAWEWRLRGCSTCSVGGTRNYRPLACDWIPANASGLLEAPMQDEAGLPGGTAEGSARPLIPLFESVGDEGVLLPDVRSTDVSPAETIPEPPRGGGPASARSTP